MDMRQSDVQRRESFAGQRILYIVHDGCCAGKLADAELRCNLPNRRRAQETLVTAVGDKAFCGTAKATVVRHPPKKGVSIEERLQSS
jgi:hypothetical protein